jgi:hypothetical protein
MEKHINDKRVEALLRWRRLLNWRPLLLRCLQAFRWQRAQTVAAAYHRSQFVRARLRGLLWRGWTRLGHDEGWIFQGKPLSLRDNYIFDRTRKLMAAAGLRQPYTCHRLARLRAQRWAADRMDDERAPKRALDAS